MRHQTQAGAGRIALFDNIKGLLIILVVVGHVAHPVHNDNPAISCLFDVIYLFHMPLFVFVSGLFAKHAKNERGGVNPNRILSFALLAALYQLALMLINGASLTPGRFLQFTSAPWYLLAMAYWYAAAPMLLRLGWRRGMALSLALSYASGLVDLSDGLLAISRSLAFLPWFAAGLYCPVEQVVAFKESRSRPVRATLAAAVVLAAAIALARVLDARAYDWFFQMVYGDNPYRARRSTFLAKRWQPRSRSSSLPRCCGSSRRVVAGSPCSACARWASTWGTGSFAHGSRSGRPSTSRQFFSTRSGAPSLS